MLKAATPDGIVTPRRIATASSRPRVRGGSWTIHPDHLERVTAHEARAAEKTPVRITTLTSRDLDTLPAMTARNSSTAS